MNPAAAHARITIVVNGEARQVPADTTVAALLAELDLASGRVAVEVNEQVVARGARDTHRLAAGDRLEIVHFVGGG